MANTNLNIPDFDFANFYYGEIVEALIQFKRIYAPELTDESAEELSIIMLQAFALVGHLNNTNLDSLANENTLPTAKLTPTVRNMLRLIDYELQPNVPSQADVIYELSRVFSVPTQIISEKAQCATKRTDEEAIFFEALNELVTDRTDLLSYVLSEETGSIFTDYTSEANDPTSPASDWTPWGIPASKNAIYFGHKHIMWDKLSFSLSSPMSGITGVFEFYDGDFRKTNPTSVTDLGSTLQFDLSSLLGAQNREGTLVRVQLNTTTSYEDVYSTWTGTKNIVITGFLGQTTPSTDENDYTIGSDWSILEIDDQTLDFTVDGDVNYTLPQDEMKNWIASDVDGKTAFWIRFRIISVTVAISPIFKTARIDLGKQYVVRSVTQGKTHLDSPKSSTGIANQVFTTEKDHFIFNSEIVTVDGDTWIRVDNFLNSESASKHYQIVLGDNDRAFLKFGGDGKGQIPPTGSGNITIEYRYGADINGNVGSNTIVVDKTGLSYVSKIYNPRVATGWKEAEGSTPQTLEKAKIEGPASIRVKEVAISPDDVEYLTIKYTDENGASPFSRASAFEGGYGPKTIELVVVASGGGLASSTQLENLKTYFNGDKYSSPPLKKHLIANQEVIATNYTQKQIDITAVVYGDIEKSLIENELTRIFQPEAYKEDGITFRWKFGDSIPVSKIVHEIFDIDDDSITKVEVSTPSSEIILQPRELPIIGNLSITVIGG